MDPETPSAVVVGAADCKMEKGVSNEVWGTCGASWTFVAATTKHVNYAWR